MRARRGYPLGIYLAIAAGLIAAQALTLLAMGHPPICTCGTIRLWVGSISSAQTSQQLTDWYTFSHVVHGFLFYLLLWWLAPRTPIGLRFALAIGIEVTWEIVENTPFVIDRYRQTALALGYRGDSILNSVSDTLSMAFGFLLARTLPVRLIVALAIAEELFVGAMIHDNLTLNIIQLVHPSATLSHWQSGK